MYLAWQLGVEVLPMWRLALEMLAFPNQVSQADSPSFSKVFVFFISVSIKTKNLKLLSYIPMQKSGGEYRSVCEENRSTSQPSPMDISTYRKWYCG